MIKNMAFGVDLGWVSQLEQMGYSWIDNDGKKVDPIQACKDMGANAVRLRIFVNPPEKGFWQKNENELCMLGFCDAQSVLEVSKRVKNLEMDLMLDFHYSDHFADPLVQDIPEKWKSDDDCKLTERIYEHTKSVLQLFKDNEVYPKWVQVGNEINHGILWSRGSLETAPVQLVKFLNSGYDAVKEIMPECQVITHLAEVNNGDWCIPFLDNFFAHNGKTDIIGFSYYPYWYKPVCETLSLSGWLAMYQEKYGKPIVISEVGGEDTDEEATYKLLCDSVEAVMELPENAGLGVFYWEPEVNRAVLPDHYPLGAARLVEEHTLQYTSALTAYGKYSHTKNKV